MKTIEEIVEELMSSWGSCDLQYRSEYDRVEKELREALKARDEELMEEIGKIKEGYFHIPRENVLEIIKKRV